MLTIIQRDYFIKIEYNQTTIYKHNLSLKILDKHLFVFYALGKVEGTRSLGERLYNRSRCNYRQYKCFHNDNLHSKLKTTSLSLKQFHV